MRFNWANSYFDVKEEENVNVLKIENGDEETK